MLATLFTISNNLSSALRHDEPYNDTTRKMPFLPEDPQYKVRPLGDALTCRYNVCVLTLGPSTAWYHAVGLSLHSPTLKTPADNQTVLFTPNVVYFSNLFIARSLSPTDSRIGTLNVI